jgi:hypothetical protein
MCIIREVAVGAYVFFFLLQENYIFMYFTVQVCFVVLENEFAELVPETTSFIEKIVIVNVILYLYSIYSRQKYVI